MKASLSIYIAASFRHVHGVRLLGRELAKSGCHVLDWTAKATPPPGLTPAERRAWMDTDQDGGQVYSFCRSACQNADLLVYYGASGQDAGVEIGIASAAGVPILGIRGPLEAPGLMLHGAVAVWVDSIEDAIEAIDCVSRLTRGEHLTDALHPAAATLIPLLNSRINSDFPQNHIDAKQYAS